MATVCSSRHMRVYNPEHVSSEEWTPMVVRPDGKLCSVKDTTKASRVYDETWVVDGGHIARVKQ